MKRWKGYAIENDIVERLNWTASQISCLDKAIIAEAADTIERQRAELAEFEKLRDPELLHANLLRGQPSQLSREQFLHLAGDAQPAQEPPARQPLTDEQLRDIFRDVSPGQIPASYTAHWPGLKAFARAVERAHGIGRQE